MIIVCIYEEYQCNEKETSHNGPCYKYNIRSWTLC